MTKVCTKCKASKALSDFGMSKGYYRSNCRICESLKAKDYYNALNPEQKTKRRLLGLKKAGDVATKQYQAKYRQKNKEKLALYNKEYKEKNPQKIKEIKKKWSDSNKSYYTAKLSERRATKIKATPSWLNESHKLHIHAKYSLANMLTNNTEQKWHVDHIIPLRNPSVCGLHVPWNLKVITAKENLTKNNKVML